MRHQTGSTRWRQPTLAVGPLVACGMVLWLVSTSLLGGCEEGPPPSEGTAGTPSAETVSSGHPASSGQATPGEGGSGSAAVDSERAVAQPTEGEGEAVQPTGGQTEVAPAVVLPVEWITFRAYSQGPDDGQLSLDMSSLPSEEELFRLAQHQPSSEQIEARLRYLVDPSRTPALSRPVALPRSSSAAPLGDDKVAIAVSPEAILVNLETVLVLEDGAIPAAARAEAGDPDDPILPALRDPLETALHVVERWARLDQTEVDPSASLLIAADVPYQLVATVMLNASAAGVAELSAVVAEVPFEALWEPAGEASAEAAPLHAVPIDSPQIQAGPRTGPPAPQLLVSITPEGFVLGDLADPDAFEALGLSEPLPGCLPPVVVCQREGVTSDRLLDRLDFRGLYNRLVRVKRSARWAAAPDVREAARIHLTAEPGVPWEVLVRTMDVARAVLERDVYEADADFFAASAGDETLFPRVVLLLPLAVGPPSGALRGPSPGEVETTRLGRAFDEAIAESGALERMFEGESPTDLGEGDVYVVGRGEGGLGVRGEGGLGRVHGVGEIDTGGGRRVSAELGRRGRRAPRARMDRGATSVDGSLEVEQVARVVRRHSRGLRYCYERELMDDPGLEGEVVIALTIGSDGSVVDRSIVSNQLENQEVESCLLREAGRMQFPEPADGDPVTVTQSLEYRAVR